MPNLVDLYKTIFLGKWGKASNSPKAFSLYRGFLLICFEFCQNPKSNLLGHAIFVQSSRMPKTVDEYKTIFLGKRDKPWNSSKSFSLYGVPYKFSCGPWNIGSRLYNDKFDRRKQNHSFEEARQSFKLSKNFLSILELSINLFWSLPKT